MQVIVAVIMVLYTSSGVLEHVYHDGISSCLKQKRQIERYGWKDSENTRYACEKRKIEIITETNEVVKIIE